MTRLEYWGLKMPGFLFFAPWSVERNCLLRWYDGTWAVMWCRDFSVRSHPGRWDKEQGGNVASDAVFMSTYRGRINLSGGT